MKSSPTAPPGKSQALGNSFWSSGHKMNGDLDFTGYSMLSRSDDPQAAHKQPPDYRSNKWRMDQRISLCVLNLRKRRQEKQKSQEKLAAAAQTHGIV